MAEEHQDGLTRIEKQEGPPAREPGWQDLVEKLPRELGKDLAALKEDPSEEGWLRLMQNEDVGPKVLTFFFGFMAARDINLPTKQLACRGIASAIEMYDEIETSMTRKIRSRSVRARQTFYKNTPFTEDILIGYELPLSGRFQKSKSNETVRHFRGISMGKENAFKDVDDSGKVTGQPLYHLVLAFDNTIASGIMSSDDEENIARDRLLILEKFLTLGEAGVDVYGPAEIQVGRLPRPEIVRNIEMADLFPALFPDLVSYEAGLVTQIYELQAELEKIKKESAEAPRLMGTISTLRDTVARLKRENASLEQQLEESKEQRERRKVPKKRARSSNEALGIKPGDDEKIIRRKFRERNQALNPEHIRGQIKGLRDTGHADLADHLEAMFGQTLLEMNERLKEVNAAHSKIRQLKPTPGASK